MSRRSFFFFAAILCSPLVNAAEPLLSLGEKTPLYITAVGTVRNDDNVYLTPRNKESDTVFVLTPGLDLAFSGAQVQADLALTEQFVRYRSESQLDSNLTTLIARLSKDSPRSRLAFKASYQEVDQNTFSVRNVDQSVRRNLTEISANTSWNVTAKTGFGVGASYARTEYPATSFVGNKVWAVPLDYYYAVSPKLDLSTGYQYRHTTLDVGTNDAKDHFANIGARGQFTPKLNGQVRVGYTKRERESGDSGSLLGLASTLTYAFSPKTTFDLSVGNDFSSSASGASQKVFTVGTVGRFELSQRWSINTGVSLESAQYLTVPKRKDEFWVGNLGVSYALTMNASFELSYLYRENSSNVTVVNFDNTIVSFSASIRF